MSAIVKQLPTMYPIDNENINPKENAHEENDQGFVFLFRQIRTHWIWQDPVKFRWWVDILLEVNHADRKVPFGFVTLDCKRGQSLHSLLEWSKRWRVDVSTVRRFFRMLTDDGMVVIENMEKTTRLTVCNYDSYQQMQHATQFTNNSDAIHKQFGRNTNNKVVNNNTISTTGIQECVGEAAKPPASAPKKSFKNISDQEFKDELKPHLETYGRDTLNAFYKYWSEKSASGKMRFQLQQTWETKKRLEAWARRDDIPKPTLSRRQPDQLTAPPLKTPDQFNIQQ